MPPDAELMVESRNGFVKAAMLLVVLALPLALVLSNVRLLVFDPGYYLRGYERFGGAQATRMSPEQLAEATAQIQAYFGGGPPVSLVVQKEWGREPLFNAREQQHLADVRDLLDRTLRVQEVSAAYVLGVAATLLVLRRSAGAKTLARWVSVSTGLTLATFVVLGLLAIGDFQSFWTQFHLLSFSNDLWMLDPRTDYMIRMYPAPFWFNAILDIIVRSALGAIVLLLLAQGYLRWRGGRVAKADRSAPSP
ncbi:MAG: TIGR01906 family membrane protein [Chloroflexi bacterium]|nr:TIGR01906 family membrane protein [Chloroflexota bacterium]